MPHAPIPPQLGLELIAGLEAKLSGEVQPLAALLLAAHIAAGSHQIRFQDIAEFLEHCTRQATASALQKHGFGRLSSMMVRSQLHFDDSARGSVPLPLRPSARRPGSDF